MKLAILLFAVFITGVITLSGSEANISGTWVMRQNKILSNLPVMRIEMNKGIWQGKIDIPEVEEYDRDIHSIRVVNDSVFITLFKNGTTIHAALVNDSTLTGEMSLDGSKDPVTFVKYSKPR